MKRNRPQQSIDPRRGSVLLAVLVVVLMLSLGAYAFTELMLLERESTELYGRDAQARAFADSGLEHVMALLGTRAALHVDENFYHYPELFQAHVIADGPVPRARGGFSIVAPVESDPSSQMIRFGLVDESGKLNLNALVKFELSDEEMNWMLLALPGMTPEIADAILDYIDEDVNPRPYSAFEDQFNKNAPLDSLDELLAVPGLREQPWLLLGEDWNRNGLLDPGEDANGNGLLDLGWSAFLTVHSRESNRRLDGSEKIYLNDNLLSDLWDRLEAEYGEDVATFIVAYRINGPYVEEEEESGSGSGEGGGGGSGRSGRGGRSDGDQAGGAEESSDAEMQELAQRAAENVARGLAGGGSGEQANLVTRGGMDLTRGGRYRITSIYDLVDVQVQATIEGEEETLDSPWTVGSLPGDLPQLMDGLTTVEGEFIEGRININQARFETLLAIPEMTEDLALAIFNSKMIGPAGEPLNDVVGLRSTTGWLVAEGLVDLPTMRRLDRYMTARGDVFRVQSVGHYFEGGPIVRLEAVIDSAQFPPRIVSLRDLTHLGRGYSLLQLVPPMGLMR